MSLQPAPGRAMTLTDFIKSTGRNYAIVRTVLVAFGVPFRFRGHAWVLDKDGVAAAMKALRDFDRIELQTIVAAKAASMAAREAQPSS